ncbi:UDP-phosphate alpha N-acetylglucosaminyltransferase [uncultured Roseibium sp.]|uniref:UDP-phosphate alpha N-acetylglucosaminyltransferase n=1 Tax=uncultured Roseibium sp. TaxID=1936171 RepID=UPI002593359C|nr:UDP-phosphate alpha N-acetylglucosaminyltransferase [uncultured Roseibium sp.]
MSSLKQLDSVEDWYLDDQRYRFWIIAVFATVVGCLTFNFFLAIINTNVSAIRESHVVVSELMLISCGLLLALTRSGGFYALLVLFLTYMAFILALRSEVDLKAIRDILIPITFYFIGRRFRSLTDADHLILLAALIVTGIALFEFLMLDVFTSIVNIFDYYVARGSLAADDNFVEGSTLFISSTRIGGRNFFGFLGNVRASSVFLEPVTMGNFGAFLCLWALFRTDMQRRFLLFFLAFLVIVLGDARFGMFVCLAFLAALPFARIAPSIVWWLIPFIVMALLGLYGEIVHGQPWEDNLAGRIVHSAQLMAKLEWASAFGIEANLPFLDDNGYAYTLSQIGVIGTIVLWSLFVFTAGQRSDALRFKALAVVFICLLMIVSNSFYSIKLAALFWLAAGAVDATGQEDLDQNRSSETLPKPITSLRKMLSPG